jgi:hypothetical protein
MELVCATKALSLAKSSALRFAKNPIRTYIIISVIFLFISFIPDIAAVSAPMPGAGWPYSITLMIMHVVAGFITVYMLIKLTTTENK